MSLTIEALRSLALAKRQNNIQPVGSAENAVPGLFTLVVPVEAFRFDGSKTLIKGFSTGDCLLHQGKVLTNGFPLWKDISEFHAEDPYAGFAELLGVECAMPALAAA